MLATLSILVQCECDWNVIEKAYLNPLSVNSTKWSNTFKQLPTNYLSVFDHFVGQALKGLKVALHVTISELIIESLHHSIGLKRNSVYVTAKAINFHKCIEVSLQLSLVSFLRSLLLTLNLFHTLFWCFHIWLWKNECVWEIKCFWEMNILFWSIIFFSLQAEVHTDMFQ